jgi:hypothetical protein
MEGADGAARERVLVTGADAAYFRCLAQLLASVARYRRSGGSARLRCIVVDLGLGPGELAILARRFAFAEVRRFDFSRHPAFLRPRARPVNTNAWKPLAIDDVLATTSGLVVWLDAASVVTGDLDSVFRTVARTGFYVPFGGGASTRERTHPGTFAHFGLSPARVQGRMRASGVFGVDAGRAIGRRLVAEWAAACKVEMCVAPPGATLANHRFDQSVLNVLLHLHADTIELTDDELDISSPWPTPVLRTRNKVKNGVPLALDPLVRAWFASYRAVDVALWKLRTRRTVAAHKRAARARAVNAGA